jgi:hypothetical protein
LGGQLPSRRIILRFSQMLSMVGFVVPPAAPAGPKAASVG